MLMSPSGVGSWPPAHLLSDLAYGCLYLPLSCCSKLARMWSLNPQLTGGNLALSLGALLLLRQRGEPTDLPFAFPPLTTLMGDIVHISEYSRVCL